MKAQQWPRSEITGLSICKGHCTACVFSFSARCVHCMHACTARYMKSWTICITVQLVWLWHESWKTTFSLLFKLHQNRLIFVLFFDIWLQFSGQLFKPEEQISSTSVAINRLFWSLSIKTQKWACLFVT